MEKAGKRIAFAVLGVILGAVAVLLTLTSIAYFSKKEIYDGYFSGEVELLFDRLNEEGRAAYQEASSGITVSEDADWGTAENPYVISNVRHLYNLAELQRLGYFYTKHISQNSDGNYSNIPHFLVCTPDYTPVLIDGSQFKGITSIGTDQYPFIGSLCGVENAQAAVTVDGKSCATSVIHNIKVSGNPANVDAGLFGIVGYLGDAPESGSFYGQVSTLSHLVLVDVQVTVNSTLWDAVNAFIEDIAINAAGHRYSYTDLYATDPDGYASVPHENHHIGILAGHASYAVIEYISVYYTSDNIVAMDLSDATVVNGVEANYLSSTGILGFIDNVNPDITVDENGVQSISAGSGDSTTGLSYSPVGGGGTTSGNKVGYVLAVDMYNTYCYTKSGDGSQTMDDDGTIILKDAVDVNGNALCTEWIRDRLLWGTEATGRYYFYDGVFTFALSSQEDVIEPTWNDTADEFSIGSTDKSQWQVNYSKGNKAMVAYIQKITSSVDLNAAIGSGKQIFIMKESASDIFLMSLYTASTAGSGDFEVKYSTPGVSQQFGDAEFVNSLIESYRGGDLSLPDDMIGKGYTVDNLAEALSNGDLRAINVGITGSTVTVDDLKNKYQITPAATGDYSYFSGEKPVPVNSDGTLNEYYDYSTSGYDGYFYYTVENRILSTIYTYYWQPQNGIDENKTVTIKEVTIRSWQGESTAHSQIFSDTGNTWGDGEKVVSGTVTVDGVNVDCTGVAVNKSAGTFYNTGNTANANGTSLTKPATTAVYYFYRDVGSTNYYHSTDATTSLEITDAHKTGTYSLSGDEIYSVNGKTGVLLDRYPTYTFSAIDKDGNNNILRMVKANFDFYGTHYALWNGTDANAGNTGNFTHTFLISQTPSSVTNSTAATIRFQADGTCYIQYGVDSTDLYVNSTGSIFNTATSHSMDGTKLCIYTVEGMQAINYGRVTFDPASGTDSHTFNTDETVLFATPSHTTDAGGSITGTSTAYTVTPISDLNWNNGNGEMLSSVDLQKKFRMIKGITFGASFNLGGGTLGTSGIVTAPVGSEGVEANIPQSCVAFRINKASADSKIRVIVSVAMSEYYPEEEGYTLGEYTRYFNLWKMEEAGSSTVQIFEAAGDNLLDRFEIPRSHPYQPGTTAAVSSLGYIGVKYNEIDYGCFLNGDRILIAYEFTVDTTAAGHGVGVFCLGMSGIDGDGNVVADVPMEIVYFSADGVASAGRDGISGSQIGSVDFVYDYGNRIITVEDSSSTDANGKEDYSTYYPSYCLLYFDTSQKAANPSAYVSVKNEKVKIRRYVIGDTEEPISDENHTTTISRSTLAAILGGDGYVKIAQYSRFADNVIIS